MRYLVRAWSEAQGRRQLKKKKKKKTLSLTAGLESPQFSRSGHFMEPISRREYSFRFTDTASKGGR